MMTIDRFCINCGGIIVDRGARARYCSDKCYLAPRFHNTYCNSCNNPLVVGIKVKNKTKYCSLDCERKAKRVKYLSENPGFNEDYFAEPNLENSYWAGFIAADGCVTKPTRGQRRLQVVLASKDDSHVYLLRDSIGGGRVRAYRRKSNSSEKMLENTGLYVASDRLCEDLESGYNITPRKTFSLKPPNLEDDLAYAFIAGYIDGDGCYGIRNGRPRIQIAGTHELLSWVSNIFGYRNTPGITSGENVYHIQFSGDNAINMRATFKSLDLPLLRRKSERWEALGADLEIKHKSERITDEASRV